MNIAWLWKCFNSNNSSMQIILLLALASFCNLLDQFSFIFFYFFLNFMKKFKTLNAQTFMAFNRNSLNMFGSYVQWKQQYTIYIFALSILHCCRIRDRKTTLPISLKMGSLRWKWRRLQVFSITHEFFRCRNFYLTFLTSDRRTVHFNLIKSA